jgi:hypothetical protein
MHEELAPRPTAADFSLPTPATPSNAVTPSPSVPPPGGSRVLSVVPLHHSLHPSKGIHAIGPRGKACSVLYLYGAAQAMALAASTSSTTVDPRSMDLLSIGALVGFYNACLGFLVKQTWLDAVKAGNCDLFDGLTYSNMSRYCPNTGEKILGHLVQQRQNVRSTKPKPKTPPAPTPTNKPPPPSDVPSHQVFIKVHP